jgi:TetR/AcrR family transcriptional regulator
MQEKNANMEQTILEVAERLFLEKGFALTSTTEIAREVGCNQALVHYYFRTKDNLFNSIFETKFRAFFQKIFNMNFDETMSFTEKIRLMAETHFDLLAQNPKMPALIIKELARKPDQLRSLRDKLHVMPEQLYARLDNDLQNEIKAGRVREVSVMDIVVTVVSLNIALFTVFPIAAELLEFNEIQIQMIMQHRRAENVVAVLNYLKP